VARPRYPRYSTELLRPPPRWPADCTTPCPATSTPPPRLHARCVQEGRRDAAATTLFALLQAPPMPGCTGVNVFLTSFDGLWCDVNEHTGQVWEAVPTLLWATVEDAHRQWRELGEPGWDRFGLTVTSDLQWVWLDAPAGHHSWPLRPLQ
jgi:hypothetical protein